MKHRIWFLIVAVVAAALDLWTKHLAFSNIPEGGSDVRVIEGFFSFGRTTNKGIVFGLFPGAGPVFLVVSILAVPAILFIFLSVKKPRWVLTAALALILGGTIGNMYDRVFNDGAVRDFLKFYWGTRVWPLFNLADSCICVGVALLSLEMLFFDEKRKRPEDPALSTEKIAVGETEPMPRADLPERPDGPKADGLSAQSQ